jgi:predicted pyridoxine 5'-phosphate oxidase superfamily flavin-nucleotide-binding protein
MGKLYPTIEPRIRDFILAQRLFFVATAPSEGGHVNVSPKGYSALRVLGPSRVAYVDYPGSGVETIAHLRDNGRIVIMVCAFEGPPLIVRLHGQGRVVEPSQEGFSKLLEHFEVKLPPRSIIVVEVERIADSCGYSVPLFEYKGDRDQLQRWANKKQRDGKLDDYHREKNRASIDGLAGLDWVARET